MMSLAHDRFDGVLPADNLVEAAVQNARQGTCVFELFLECLGTTAEVTENVLILLSKNREARMVKPYLDCLKGSFVSKRMREVAAGNDI